MGIHVLKFALHSFEVENPARAKNESWESPYRIGHFTISDMPKGQTAHVYGVIFIQYNQSWCCKAKSNTV